MPSLPRFAPLLLCGAFTVPGLGSPDAAAAGDEALMARGAELLAPFKQELKAALQAGLAEGPAAAVAACNEQAPAIAARQASDTLRVGRSSHRLRNPANAPEPWLAPVLAAYLDSGATPEPQLQRLGEGRIAYVEPIMMQGPCLLCHGDTLAPEVAARIETLYPNDEATGFSLGELRGVFWVEYLEK